MDLINDFEVLAGAAMLDEDLERREQFMWCVDSCSAEFVRYDQYTDTRVKSIFLHVGLFVVIPPQRKCFRRQ